MHNNKICVKNMKKTKHTIERKLEISKVDETHCVCMCVAYLDRITIRHSLYVGIWGLAYLGKYNLN